MPETTETGTTGPEQLKWRGHVLTLRPAPKGRKTIIFDYTPPGGKRVQRAVPHGFGETMDEARQWAYDFLESRAAADKAVETVVADHLQYTRIGKIWSEFEAHKLPSFGRKQFRDDLILSWRLFTEKLGDKFDVRDLDQTHVDTFAARRKLGMRVQLDKSAGFRTYGPASSKTIRYGLDLVGMVFEWARKRKIEGRWMLETHPFDRLKLPKALKGRTTVFGCEWYDAFLPIADQVDPTGRFRLLLALVRWTGHRQDAVGRLIAGDLCLNADAIRAAVTTAQLQYCDAEEAALTWTYGALYFRSDNQKGAKNHQADPRDYDRVLPIGPEARSEIDRYLAKHRERLQDPAAPLFATVMDDSRSIYRDLPQKWFLAAEGICATRGVTLPARVHTRWHGFRRQRRTELKRAGVHDKDAALLGGWSLNGHATQSDVLNGAYLGFSAVEIFEAACVGSPQPKLAGMSGP